MTPDALLARIATMADERCSLTEYICYAARSFGHTPAYPRVSGLVSMPGLYSVWEGFFKEAVGYYLQYVDELDLDAAVIQTPLIHFALTGARQTHADQDFIESLRSLLASKFKVTSRDVAPPMLFWETVSRILSQLCLPLDTFPHTLQRKLDAFVHLRNNVAHGALHNASLVEIQEHAEVIRDLVKALEAAIGKGVERQTYAHIGT